MTKAEIAPWHRRHALQLASQLPENPIDARLVLRAVAELVDDFLTKPEPEAKPVVKLFRDPARPSFLRHSLYRGSGRTGPLFRHGL
jgi:hypothetical protein